MTQKEQRQIWRAQGVCLDCGAPRMAGRVTCQPCAEKRTAERRACYLYAKQFCMDCKKPNKTGRLRCPECAERYRVRQRRKREDRIRKGFCIQCGKVNADTTRQCCPDCRKTRAATAARFRERHMND